MRGQSSPQDSGSGKEKVVHEAAVAQEGRLQQGGSWLWDVGIPDVLGDCVVRTWMCGEG